MSQYQVEYNILVNTNNAPQVLMAFEQAVAPLKAAANTLSSVAKSVTAFNNATRNLQNRPINIKINIANGVEAKLDRLIKKIQQVKQAARGAATLGINTAGTTTRTSSIAGNRVVSTPVSRVNAGTAGLSYKVLGPTPLTSDGGASISFLKGMGIAYGIAGAGQLVSNILKNATEYDNTIQTARNILSSHDNRPYFNQRFSEMEGIIRQVGVETKFTAPEVADAARFLAMAGLNIEQINQAIRPIADIALIGDTDIGETADVVTNIMTAYNKPASEMRNVADILTMTFTKSNTTLMEMAEAFKYSAAILSAGDVRFEESAAAIGILGDAGIKGSQAGTTLRTIMANIVNPTKKQKAAWEAIGVDPSGKSPYEVFLELSNKDLEVKNFYQLFHKTAAQGAVALTDHIDKWKEILVDNLISWGISTSLSDAKKNTIQGLWAQVTSMFTEDGMTAFAGIQGTIKQMLRGAIEYLKQPEVQEKFKEIAQDLIGFVKILKDSISQIMRYFEKFGWAIKTYFKFQLWVWPIMQLTKALRSLWFTAQLLLRLPKAGMFGFGGWGLMKKNQTVQSAGYMMANGVAPTIITQGSPYDRVFWIPTHRTNSMMNKENRRMWRRLDQASMYLSGGMLPATRLNYKELGKFSVWGDKASMKSQKQALWQLSAAEYRKQNYRKIKPLFSSEEFARWKQGTQPLDFQQYKKNLSPSSYKDLKNWYSNFRGYENAKIREIYNEKVANVNKEADAAAKRYRNQRRLAGIGGAALGVGTGLAMAAASDWSPGGWMMGGLTAAASIAAIGGPAGWIGAGIVALGSFGVALWQAHEASEAALRSLDELNKTFVTFNGLYIGQGTSAAAIELELVYKKNMDLNDIYREQIRLIKILRGDPDNTLSSDGSDLDMTLTSKLTENYKNIRENLLRGDVFGTGGWTLAKRWIKVTDESAWHDNPFSFTGGGRYWWGGLKPTYALYHSYLTGDYSFLPDPSGTATRADVLDFATQAMTLAASGGAFEKIRDEYNQRFTRELYSGTLTPETWEILKSQWDDEYGKQAWLKKITLPANSSWFDNASFDELTSPTVERLVASSFYNDWLATIVLKALGEESENRRVVDAFMEKVKAGDTELSEEDAIKVWSAFDNSMGALLQGYVDGLPDSFRKAWDPSTGKTGTAEAIQNAIYVIEQFNKGFPFIPALMQDSLKELKERLDIYNTVLAGSGYNPVTMGALPDLSDMETVGGKTYVKNADGTYSDINEPFSFSSEPAKISARQLQQMIAVDNYNGKKSSGMDGSDDYTTTPTTPTGRDSDYKNNYKSQAAVPKQIIVNIDSLMNVESIDLSDPNKAAVIETIKQDLAQALVDVVADFTISSGNLV